jgi:hypothetical protein
MGQQVEMSRPQEQETGVWSKSAVQTDDKKYEKLL